MRAHVFKYFIPIFISIIFVVLAFLGYYYLIILVLLLANILNVIWGRFSNKEIKNELLLFYGSPNVIFIKRLSGIFLIGLVLWEIYFYFQHIQHLSIPHQILFTLCCGILSGCFIVTLAHDLLHGKTKFDCYLSSFLLIVANIPHLAADHVFGHHRNIGLSHDASTAKMNQNFYIYFWNVIIYRIKHSLIYQFGLPKYARKKIFIVSMKMTIAWLFSIIGIWLIFKFDTMVVLFFLAQGFIAYILYELINYIQHYGLKRTDESKPIDQQLSWNCYYKYTNYFLFMLPLHSLHQLPLANRKIKETDLSNAPTMSYLYFVMILLTLIPQLFFSIMNPLVKNYNKLDSKI